MGTTVLSRALTELGIYPAVILLTPPQECLTHLSLVKAITMLQEVSKSLFKITNPFKILLLFLVWMSCLKKIDLPSQEPERLRDSFPNLSKWLRCSLVCQEDSPSSLIPSPVSENSSRVLVINTQNLPSIWSVDSKKLSRREARCDCESSQH